MDDFVVARSEKAAIVAIDVLLRRKGFEAWWDEIGFGNREEITDALATALQPLVRM